ncbi:hypothetical protein GGI1_22921 [Acidithiobacillus sp. GGI-221]|nr:hypothetical protein GGI1_22921 [Acidithiobacillus sp. GGI-221]
MFEMTAALIHHARFCVLEMTNGDPVETERELTTARAFAFDAGRVAFNNNASMPTFFPETLYGAYEDGHMEACLDDSDKRSTEEWHRKSRKGSIIDSITRTHQWNEPYIAPVGIT